MTDASPPQKRFGSARRDDDLRTLWRDDAFETCLFVALIAGLAWTPFWLGSNRLLPWGANGVFFPALVALYEISVVVRGRRHPFGAKRIIVPVGLFLAAVAWIFIQMSVWSPPAMNHPIWSMAADVLGRPVDGSISVNRSATTLAFLRLLTDASVFWLALQLCRDSYRALLLLRAVATIAAIYALYGLILAAFFKSTVPLFDAPGAELSVRSTFVNRNSFATYAGMGLVTTVGLILRLYRHEVPDYGGLSSYRLGKFVEATGRRGSLLLGMGLIILAGLLGTGSRGGILTTGLGVFAALVFSATRQRRRRTEQAEAIALVALALVAGFLAFGDMIVGRIASAGLEDVNRIAVYVIVVKAILDAPFLGFGYGAFVDIFPMYRDGSISPNGVWDMAHNSYLEVLLGLGVVFGAALTASIALLALQAFRGALTRRHDATPAIVAASVALLVGVHALVDFSLEIEAVALTFAALLGVGVAQSASSRDLLSD